MELLEANLMKLHVFSCIILIGIIFPGVKAPMPFIRCRLVRAECKLLCHLDIVRHLVYNLCVGRGARGNEGRIISIDEYFFLAMAAAKCQIDGIEKGLLRHENNLGSHLKAFTKRRLTWNKQRFLRGATQAFDRLDLLHTELAPSRLFVFD